MKLNPEARVEALLSPREVAHLLGITTKTLRRWIECGRVPSPDHRFTKRTLRWRVSSITAIVEGRKK